MKKFKLFTLGMVMCCSLIMMTGCGNRKTSTNTKNEETVATEKAAAKNDTKNTTDHTTNNETTTGTHTPVATGEHTTVGEDVVNTVDNVGTDIVDGVTDVGRDLTGDDGTGNNATASPAATHHATATP